MERMYRSLIEIGVAGKGWEFNSKRDARNALPTRSHLNIHRLSLANGRNCGHNILATVHAQSSLIKAFLSLFRQEIRYDENCESISIFERLIVGVSYSENARFITHTQLKYF